MENLSELIREIGGPDPVTTFDVAGVPHVAVRNDCTLKAMPELLEREKPLRIKRQVLAHDVRGFIDYVNEFKRAGDEHGESRIYAGPFEKPVLECRIDDHQPDEPSHVTHAVTFPCPLTREWKTWAEANGKKMNQVDFAEFVDANLVDIVEPNAADLLAATLDFSNSSKGEFSSAVRLKDGSSQFKWSQDNSGMEARFPDRIKIGLRVYEGLEQSYAMYARLKFRINNGALALWLELERPDIVQRAAHEKLLAEVAEKTGCQLFRAL